MKVYTSIEYNMTEDGLVEVASDSYEYEGPVAETKGGGGQNTVVERHYYYDGGPGSEASMDRATGITGETGAPNLGIASLNPADTAAGLAPSGYAPDASGGMAGGTMVPAAGPQPMTGAIAPVNYSNPYELMNQMQPPPGIAGVMPPTGTPRV
jgi:hypothetical protein